MLKRFALIFFIGVFALAVFFGAWEWTYPHPDPKNFRYVFWKAGLYKGNVDEMTDLMIGDGHRDELVVGKTKEELGDTFGSMLTLDEASEYMRFCYQTGGFTNRNVLFIRKSAWMVEFDGDRATGIVLMKAC